MSDFGAGACDFHSDFASDFRTESNDFASDFRDFAGDFGGDFGGAPRTAKQPPEATETAPPEQVTATDEATGEHGRRQAGSAPHKQHATEQWKTSRHKAVNNAHRASMAAAV